MPISDRSQTTLGFTPASNQRLDWIALPASLRRQIEDRLDRQVVEALTQSGGFSPGVAARLMSMLKYIGRGLARPIDGLEVLVEPA